MSKDLFIEIYQTNKIKLYSFVLYKVRSESVAEDIVSDVFLKLLKEIQNNQEVTNYAVPWLYRVATNKIIDYYRNSHQSKSVLVSEYSKENNDEKDTESEKELFITQFEDNLDLLSKEEDVNKVLKALAQLKDSDKIIIEYRLFQELPFKEIAVILESTEAAVKMKYSRSIDKLKEICEKQNGKL